MTSSLVRTESGLATALSAAVRWGQNLWFASTTYLPMLLIAVLALGTWWLARNTPGATMPADEAPVTHEPDYYMRNFAVKNFDATGQLRSEIAGKQGQHYPDTNILEIDQARIRSFKANQLTTATAKKAYSNADGSEVQLVGDALVVREAGKDAAGNAQPRLEFRGEFLHAFLRTEQVKSHLPVTLKRGNDVFTADNLEYDNLGRVVTLQGRVRGTLSPRLAP
jgi:lipopolysaccharide export system protein LptC